MKKIQYLNSTVLAASLAASTVLLGACSSTPREDSRLTAASAKYEQLQSQANIGTVAPVEMRDAQIALDAAEKAVEADKDRVEIDHRIYLAQQRVDIAQQAYQRKLADSQLKEINDSRDKLRLQARTAELERTRRELAELKMQKTDRGMVMTLGDVLFDVGHAELKPGGQRMITKLAAYLQENPQRNVSIEGYTDSTGGDAYNQQLSERRADAVKAALTHAGIDPQRIQTEGYGEAYPVAGNDTAGGRQMNRRVEIVLSDDKGNVAPRS